MPGRPLTRQSHVILAELMTDPTWWPAALDRVACGTSLKEIFDEYAVLYGVGRRWVDADEQRAKDYAEAEKYYAESLAYETITIADGDGDVPRDKLRGDNRWRLAARLDRARWGDEKGAGGGGITVNLIQFNEAEVLAGAPVRVGSHVPARLPIVHEQETTPA